MYQEASVPGRCWRLCCVAQEALCPLKAIISSISIIVALYLQVSIYLDAATSRERSLPGLTPPHSHLAGFFSVTVSSYKDWTLSNEWKWVSGQSNFSMYTAKKQYVQNEKEKNAKKQSEDRLTALGKNSMLPEIKFQRKRSKTNNEVSLPAHESMKRPLIPFFPLPRCPSLRNTRLSECRASINFENRCTGPPGFQISWCGNEPRTLSPRAYTKNLYNIVKKKCYNIITENFTALVDLLPRLEQTDIWMVQSCAWSSAKVTTMWAPHDIK